jgi:hypothetical protein
LVSALDSIVWAVDPKDHSLQSVADYVIWRQIPRGLIASKVDHDDFAPCADFRLSSREAIY